MVPGQTSAETWLDLTDAAYERVMGFLLVATGIMFLTGSIQTLSYWFLELFPNLATLG